MALFQQSTIHHVSGTLYGCCFLLLASTSPAGPGFPASGIGNALHNATSSSSVPCLSDRLRHPLPHNHLLPPLFIPLLTPTQRYRNTLTVTTMCKVKCSDFSCRHVQGMPQDGPILSSRLFGECSRISHQKSSGKKSRYASSVPEWKKTSSCPSIKWQW